MKLIGKLNAAVAWRESIEEYAPERGMFAPDVINFVRATYDFQGFPQISPEQPFVNPLVFQAGRFLYGGEAVAINMLAMEPVGDTVQVTTTEQGDAFLEDLTSKMDDVFDFRLRSSIKKKSYVSNLVVEFDAGLESYIGKFAEMAALINSVRRGQPEFSIKKLAFGLPVQTLAQDQVSVIEAGEFVIDRRAGYPFEENRYFCSAPMRTADHIRVLEEIEAIARS